MLQDRTPFSSTKIGILVSPVIAVVKGPQQVTKFGAAFHYENGLFCPIEMPL